MLQRVMQDLKGDAIRARDGDVGSVKDVYFDDERWAVRYLVVDTGGWLPGRKVLISPAQVPPQPAGDAIQVELTREQVERAPGVENDAPVSRLMEAAHARYYGYPYYWAGPYLWGVAPVAYGSAAAEQGRPREDEEQREMAEQRARESHLRSSAEVIGYAIRAADGELGHVEDFVVEDDSWKIAGMVVDTRNWLPGKKVLVPPSAIADIDWEGRQVTVAMSREELKRAPEAAS
jgi:uncharacterized protein YrrD